MASVVLIEDNDADIALARFLFDDVKLCNEFQIIQNGRQALNRLLCQCEFEGQSRPDLVFLDADLPELSGMEILRLLRDSEEAEGRKTPVVILSGNDYRADVAEANMADADYCLAKPLTVQGLLRVVRSIAHIKLALMSGGEDG